MENNKYNTEIKNKAHGFSMADVDYFHSEENENAIIKLYVFKRIFIFSLLSLAALMIFIIIYLYYGL